MKKLFVLTLSLLMLGAVFIGAAGVTDPGVMTDTILSCEINQLSFETFIVTYESNSFYIKNETPTHESKAAIETTLRGHEYTWDSA